jgi:hypothetical protein
MFRFLWNASRGNRLTPWRSPYLRWRIETYTGLPAKTITFTQFWSFVWHEKGSLLRYLLWVDRMNG